MAVAIRQLTYAQAINEAMRLEMRRDPRIILLGEDVAGGAGVINFESEDSWGGVLGVTKGLVQEFGRKRVLDTPITEAGYIGAAVGAAATGLRPIGVMAVPSSPGFKKCIAAKVRQISFPSFPAPRMGARYSFGVD